MSRSLKKGPYIDEKIMEKVQKQKVSGERLPIKVWNRRCQIAPDFVGHKLSIYNGRKFIDVLITEGMVGERLGSFSPTRSFRSHGKITKRVDAKT